MTSCSAARSEPLHRGAGDETLRTGTLETARQNVGIGQNQGHELSRFFVVESGAAHHFVG